MDMLSMTRKRYATESLTSRRQSQRLAAKSKSSSRSSVPKRSTDDKCFPNIPQHDERQDEPRAISESEDGGIAIKIMAKPGAKESKITDIADDCIKVKVGSPARDEQANMELINFLGSALKLRKSTIKVESGLRSQIKTIKINQSGLTVGNIQHLMTQEFLKNKE